MSELGLLRFTTAGSVDDGKSTLIGRLLHDTRTLYEDQLEAVRRVSRDGLELAYITDGLRAEREQGITIDVAYRYFSTPRRRFRISDTPGHEQYTRNMATGASTAELAIILMDARKGVLAQTQRHASICAMLGIREIALAVNKMDLVAFSEARFREIERDFRVWAERLGDVRLTFLPVCAKDGDNVVEPSARMGWYTGPTLLAYLETAPNESDGEHAALRVPVQSVLRYGVGGRAYGGRVESGRVEVGTELLALPSQRTARVAALRDYAEERTHADVGAPVAIELDEQIDVGRGDMLCAVDDAPSVARRIEARVVWMSERPLRCGVAYLIKHTTQTVCAEAVEIRARLEPETLEETASNELALNDIGVVVFDTHRPIFCDAYERNRATGSFIVIDPATNATVGAAMIRAASTNNNGELQVRASAKRGLTVWFTGLSSAGKTTLAQAVYERLWAMGVKVELLDGDVVRKSLSKELGFSKADRDENIRRIGFVAGLLTRNGVVVLVSAISPYRAVRDEVRGTIGDFVEVFVNAPLETCEQRDVKGLYAKARRGELRAFTGIDDPYEAPLNAEVECRTAEETLAESVDKVMRYLETRLL